MPDRVVLVVAILALVGFALSLGLRDPAGPDTPEAFLTDLQSFKPDGLPERRVRGVFCQSPGYEERPEFRRCLVRLADGRQQQCGVERKGDDLIADSCNNPRFSRDGEPDQRHPVESVARPVVPRVVGLPATDAECRLADEGLRWSYGDAAESVPSFDCHPRAAHTSRLEVHPDPAVTAQSPPPDERVRPGTVIELKTECTEAGACL